MTTERSALLASGMELLKEFCEENSLSQPDIHIVHPDLWRFDACAYYREDEITICPRRCAPIGRAARAWSYPGYVIDRTPHGVLQHELGHHVDRERSGIKGAYGGDFSVALRAKVGEPKLTNYCPNDWEWFAEMFRLFITNSDLLKAVRPRTYTELRQLYRPVVDAPWAEVLKDAPPRTIEMAGKKVLVSLRG